MCLCFVKERNDMLVVAWQTIGEVVSLVYRDKVDGVWTNLLEENYPDEVDLAKLTLARWSGRRSHAMGRLSPRMKKPCGSRATRKLKANSTQRRHFMQ